MNRHLNVFVPYCLPPNHEDQLTRAAMIVLRSVPQAAEELLLRIGAHSLGQLPAMEIDMQAKSVATGSEVDELVSVFLTPDQEQSENHGFGVTHSDRAQRLDGVLRFEPAMVVVVESKVYERRDAWQAHNINLDGVTASSSRVVVLRWHDLIGDWLRLLEGNVLSLASKSDLDGRDQFERVLAGRPIHLRAGLRVQRSWTWEEALRLDDAGLLAAAIRGALGEVLTRLDEPALAPLPE